MPDCYWIRNSDETIAELRKASEGVALLPLGSIESHGPHLPLGCDPIKTDNLVRLVAERETVAVLPTLPYTYVAAARALPGAIHIRSELLMEFVEQICEEVYRNGFTKIVLLQGHGGNTALNTMFCDRMLERAKPYAVYSLSAQAGLWEEMRKTATTAEWGHACEWETSMALMACPELVRLDALKGRTFATRPGPDVGSALTPVEWISRHPEMAVGDPAAASKEKGARWLAMAAEGVAAHLRKIKADTRTLAEMREYARRVKAGGTKDGE